MTIDERWEQCDQGTIQQVASGQLRADETSRLTRRNVVAGAVAAVTAATLVIIRSGQEDALTCQQVHGVADDFVQNRLDEATVELVNAHRATCSPCDDYLTDLAAQNVG